MSIAIEPITRLTPAQQQAFDQVRFALERKAKIVTLIAREGLGRTTLLNLLARSLGGHVVSLSELSAFAGGRDPLALEESYAALLRSWFVGDTTLFVDDFDLLERWRNTHGNLRNGWFDTVSTSISDAALRHAGSVVFA